jgi:transcription elongation factor Elf1
MAKPIPVNPRDSRCRECKGRLQVIEAEDDLMTVECTECGEIYNTEIDGLGDGGIDYWPRMMAAQLEEDDENPSD